MKNALLLFGGKSFEHDISIITALIIYNRAKKSSYNLLPVYINKDDEWFFYTQDRLNISLFKDFDKNYKANGFVKAHLKSGSNFLFYKKGLKERRIEVCAALNCCHGGMGEDGHLTALLEQSKIAPSAGSMSALGICMDKVETKLYLKGLDLPVIDFFDFSKKDWENQDEVLSKAEKLGYPLILKPSTLGSSIGLGVAKNKQEFIEKAQIALEFDHHILIEKALLEDMEEYNVACLYTKDGTLVSQVDKPAREHEILSFEDKYIGSAPAGKAKGKGGSYLAKKEFADIDKKLEEKLKSLAKISYESLGLYGVVRIDFIKQGKKIYINELNTIPGSLGYYFFVPSVFKSMSEYVDKLLESAEEKYAQNNKIKKEFITTLI